MNKNLKKKKRDIKSDPCSLQSRSDSGTEADTYAKTGLCMEIANYEQSCCLSKHRHTALRGRICWQRRYYSVKL